MALLTVQDLSANGAAEVTFAAASATPFAETFPNDGRVILLVKNAGAVASRTVTATVVKDSGTAITETGTTITVAAGKIFRFGPLDPALFNSAAGLVTITADDNADLSYAVVRPAQRY